MSRPQLYWTARFLLGMAVLMLAGAGVPSSLVADAGRDQRWFVVDLLVGGAGFWLALRAVGPLVRSLGDDAQLRRDWGSERLRAFTRATTAQQVFQLLLGVARTDGGDEQAERDRVRRFLELRFTDPQAQQDLRDWARNAPRRSDLHALARSTGRGLDPAERATLYSWCCIVALTGGGPAGAGFSRAQRVALDEIARGLGIDAAYERMLFLFAHRLRGRPAGRAQGPPPGADGPAGGRNGRAGTGWTGTGWTGAGRTGEGRAGADRDGRGGAGGTGAHRRTPPLDDRRRALATLDLPTGASRELIRRRHRELVRRFHPDRHAHLGPVAQREATERFRAIQRAYELLTG